MLAIEIATNLLANAVWELGLRPLYRVSMSRLFKSEEQPPELKKAIERSAAQLVALSEQGDMAPDLWSSFLASPEVRTLVLDLFAFKMASSSAEPVLDALALAWCRHAEPVDSTRDMRATLENFGESIHDLIDVAIQYRVLAVDKSRSAARKRIAVSRLDAIATLDPTTPDRQLGNEYERFAAQLRAEVAMRYGRIEPPNILAREPVEIEQLFVPPRMIADEQLVSLQWIVESLDRRVVLGNPGAGKSTLAAKVCHDLSLHYDDPAFNPRKLIPWCIELRRLAASSNNLSMPLTDFFTEWATGSYQLSVPEGSFEWLLSRGRLLVVFDGLDELLDISMRQDVRNAVESFCRRYTATPVLITSRIVGYSQTPLDKHIFDTAELIDFDGRRVRRYATQWFNIRSSSETESMRAQHASQFIRDSAHLVELRSNPLMLALLASLHRGPGSIPRNLPDVYDSCASLLFSTWDKIKGLEVLLPFAEHVRPALRDMAWWMFTTPQLGVGVTRPQAIERTAAYLEQRRFGNADRAHAAAEDFIDFCRGRAWVFTDQGSTATNEDLFGFTHRTFLEFFSAEYLAYRKQSVEDLVAELVPYITKEELDVVARIALQIKARLYPDGADDIIAALLDALKNYKGRELNAGVSFLLRLLQGVVPSPTVARRLGSQVMVYAALASGGSASRIFTTIATIGEESRVEIARGLVAGQHDMLTDRTGRYSDTIANLIFHPSRLVTNPALSKNPALPFWEAVGKQTSEAYSEDVKAAAQAYPTIALAAWPSFSMTELIEFHGPQAAFCQTNDYEQPPVWRLLKDARSARGKRREDAWTELAAFGDALTISSAPWFNRNQAGSITLYATGLVALAKRRTPLSLDQTQRNVLVQIFMCVVEALVLMGAQYDHDRQLLDRLLGAARRSKESFFNSLSSVLETRVHTKELWSRELSALVLPEPTARLLALWASRRVSTLS